MPFDHPFSPLPHKLFVKPLRQKASKIIVDPNADRVPPACLGIVLVTGSRVKEQEKLAPGRTILFAPASGTLLPVPEDADEVMSVHENTVKLVEDAEGVEVGLDPA